MRVNIVWLKRDVRLHDHAILKYATDQDLPIILLYLFEPSVMDAPESDVRHWRFAYEGVKELAERIAHKRLQILHAEAKDVFEILKSNYKIEQILSHQETGLEVTFRRDQAIRSWCKQNGIGWKTFERDGVRRNRPNRRDWQKHWDDYMNAPQQNPDPRKVQELAVESDLFPESWRRIPDEITTTNSNFQQGGETKALQLLQSFKTDRGKSYLKHLARPAYSQDSCSRLSPYMAHGQISARRVYQETKAEKSRLGKNIDQFHNRLWWRCHYIQKLETEYQIEKEHINRGFDALEKPFNEEYFKAWSTGHTGFPMIDASMRCLIDKGYLNFRMRAMLATFWSFTLWQDWRVGATHLARLFLDFEPGIHYPQFQMQAGMTGYHPMRIFNPIVQAQKYDDYGLFIRQWVPELDNVPDNLLATPWQLSPMEQGFYNFQLGEHYPHPMVDYDQATKQAKDKYWPYRNSEVVRSHLPKLWQKHSLPQDIKSYEQELKINGQLVTESVMYNPQ